MPSIRIAKHNMASKFEISNVGLARICAPRDARGQKAVVSLSPGSRPVGWGEPHMAVLFVGHSSKDDTVAAALEA